MFGTDTIVRHHKDLARPHARVALDGRDVRPIAEISHLVGVHNIMFVGAHYKHSRVHQGYASTARPLGQDKCQMLVISSGQTKQTNARRQGHTGS